jgi:hypothetical protein
MIPRRLRPVLAILSALALCFLIGCILDSRHAGRGSEVENELGVYGVLVDESGNPVAGARVTARPSAAGIGKSGAMGESKVLVDSVLTDEKGRYSFHALSVGRYNLFGDYRSGSLVVLVPGISFADTLKGYNAGIDTLRAPGSIKGRVLLENAGKGGVLSYLAGTSYLAVTDANGDFLISGIPQGIYRVEYQAAGYQGAPDTNVMVVSGKTTPLAAKTLASDSLLPPPTPTALEAEYDTAKGIVTLKWRAVHVSDLQGYLVYRDHGPSPIPTLLTRKPVLDTVFSDTLFGGGSGAAGDFLKIPLEIYRIKAIDKGSNPSVNYSEPREIRVPGITDNPRILRLDVKGVQDGKARVGDTALFALAYSNPSRFKCSISWVVLPDTLPARVEWDSSANGRDSLVMPWKTTGVHIVRVFVTEEMSGAVWSREWPVDVLPQAGKISVPFPEYFPGDTVRLVASGVYEGLGPSAKWEWKCGDAGNFKATQGPNFELPAPVNPDTAYRCVLRVTDNAGKSALDSIRIPIMERGIWSKIADSVPIPDVSALRSCVFKGKAWVFNTHDDFGIWSTSDFVTWNHTADYPVKGYLIVYAAVVHADKIWLFTKPSSGNGLSICNSSDGVHWELVTDSTGFSDRSEFHALAFNGRIWLIGGYDRFGTSNYTVYHDVWSTSDGKAWRMESASPGFSGWYDYEVAAWNGKIWVYGGLLYNDYTSQNYPEVWSSPDGIKWEKSPEAPFGGAYHFRTRLIGFNGKLWSLSGEAQADASNAEVWTSQDGLHWAKESVPAPFRPRVRAQVLDLNGSLWVLGGYPFFSSPGNRSDVWRYHP